MLGSEIALYLSEKKKYKILVTVRELKLIKNYNFLENCKILTNVDVLNNSKIEEIIKKIKPNIIINCVGVIKQKFKQDNIKNIVWEFFLTREKSKTGAKIIANLWDNAERINDKKSKKYLSFL